MITENKTAQDFLNCPIENLTVNRSFIERSHMLGFNTIGEITSKTWLDLTKLAGFKYWWLNELFALLEKQNLLHLMNKS